MTYDPRGRPHKLANSCPSWWAWNVKEISHSTTRYDKGDLKTLRAAHRNLAKGVDFLTVERTGKPGRTRTMCSDSGFRKALYGFQVNPEAPMVLTIAGCKCSTSVQRSTALRISTLMLSVHIDYGGRSKAAWVPRDRRRWPILSTPLESVDVCEGEHLRILEPRGKKDAQLVICDSFYATADLDDSRPPAQLTEPASEDDLSRKRYAAARLIYATMHLRNPKKCKTIFEGNALLAPCHVLSMHLQRHTSHTARANVSSMHVDSDPVMYYASDKKRTRLSINDPTAIAVMNKVPQYMTIVSPKDSPPDPYVVRQIRLVWQLT